MTAIVVGDASRHNEVVDQAKKFNLPYTFYSKQTRDGHKTSGYYIHYCESLKNADVVWVLGGVDMFLFSQAVEEYNQTCCFNFIWQTSKAR